MKTIIILILLVPQLVLAQITELKGYHEILTLEEITHYEPKGLLPFIDMDFNGSYTDGYQYVYCHWDLQQELYEQVLQECSEFLSKHNASIGLPGFDQSTVENIFDHSEVLDEIIYCGKKIEMKWYLNVNGKNTMVILVAGANDLYREADILFTVCQFDATQDNDALFNDLTQYKP